jgi:hypothetical protein
MYVVQDAVAEMNGKEVFGTRIRVEIARGGRGGGSSRGGRGDQYVAYVSSTHVLCPTFNHLVYPTLSSRVT